jgi:N-acetylmuramoyl-L-alanine amidase CwlA
MVINKNITPFNRWIGRDGNKVEWIVLHYTANTYQPDLARNECAAFAERYVGASAHFFVDENEVWQSVAIDDTAWHCGDNPPSKNGATNRNSIGIEMCVVYKNGVYSIPDKTVDNAAALVLELLEAFPEAKICRHYDATGKRCPMPWVDDPGLWGKFKARIEENRPMTPAEKKEFETLKSQVATLITNEARDAKDIAKANTDIGKINEHIEPKYHKVEDCPDWAKPTIKKLHDRGDLKGVSKNDLGLNEDTTRVLVITDRAGGFDK